MSNITDEQIRAVFDIFDADGSGFVDTDELGLALQSLGFGVLPQEEIDHMLRTRDDDPDKEKVEPYEFEEDNEPVPAQLDFVDFRHFIQRFMFKRNSTEEMLKAFALFAGASKSKIVTPSVAQEQEEDGDLTTKYVSSDDLMTISDKLGEFIPRKPTEDKAGKTGVQRRRDFLRREFDHLLRYTAESRGAGAAGAKKGIPGDQWCSIMMEAVTDKRHRPM